MDIETLGWILVILAGVCSAIVRNFMPKENSFWNKILNILNYISVSNPRGSIVIPYDDYEDFVNFKRMKRNDINVEPIDRCE